MDTGRKGLSFSEVASETLAEFGEAALDASPADDVEVEDSDTEIVTEQPENTTSKPPSVLGDLLENDDAANNTLGDSQRVEVNGQWLTIDELKSGYMMRSDYTKKTQELAEAREKNANAIALWEALQSDPMATLRKLNTQLNTGQPIVPDKKAQSVDSVDIDKLVEQKLQERLESNPVFKSIMDDRARSAVDKAFKKIEDGFNVILADTDKAIILSKAQEIGTTDLEFVFSGLYAQAERMRAMRNNAKSASTSVGYRGDANTPTESRDDDEITDFRSALDSAMHELKIESLI